MEIYTEVTIFMNALQAMIVEFKFRYYDWLKDLQLKLNQQERFVNAYKLVSVETSDCWSTYDNQMNKEQSNSNAL